MFTIFSGIQVVTNEKLKAETEGGECRLTGEKMNVNGRMVGVDDNVEN